MRIVTPLREAATDVDIEMFVLKEAYIGAALTSLRNTWTKAKT